MSDLIACDGCGRSFKTDDAAGMLAAIKGPCPSCGGTFRHASLGATPTAAQLLQPPAHRR